MARSRATKQLMIKNLISKKHPEKAIEHTKNSTVKRADHYVKMPKSCKHK